MHHMDIPWKPAELEQRDGRGARQGNTIAKQFYHNKVRNYIYAVEQSLDNYKFNLLKNKQTFISQMKNCELNVRTLDEGAIDEKSGMNFSEYIAILSGDTSLLEKTKVEKKVAVLEGSKSAHFKEVARSRNRLQDVEKEIVKTKETLDKLTADESLYKSDLKFDKDGAKVNAININGLTDPEEIGKYINKLYLTYKGPDEQKIGLHYMVLNFTSDNRKFLMKVMACSSMSLKMICMRNHQVVSNTCGTTASPIPTTSKLAARYFLNAIDRVTTLRGEICKRIR